MKHALIWDNPWELPVPSSQTHLDIFQEGWLICLETLEGVIHFKVSILRYSTRLHFNLLHDTMVLRGDWQHKSFWQDSAIDPHSNQDWFKTDYKISALPINLCLIVVGKTNMDWSGHGQKPGSPSLPTTCTDSSPPLHIFHGQAIMARNQQVQTFPSHYRFFPGCT